VYIIHTHTHSISNYYIWILFFSRLSQFFSRSKNLSPAKIQKFPIWNTKPQHFIIFISIFFWGCFWLREKVLEIVPEALHVSFFPRLHTHTRTPVIIKTRTHTHTMAPIESDVQVFNDEKRIARELYEHKWFTRYISI
jgi:hypothetical protein